MVSLESVIIFFLVFLVFGFGILQVLWIDIESSRAMRREIPEGIQKGIQKEI